MGLRVLDLELTNCGTRPYTVNSYPALRILDNDRKPLDVKIGEGTATVSKLDHFNDVPTTVTVQPGGKLEAGLVWRNTVTDPTVTATDGIYLDVAPTSADPWQTVKPKYSIDLGNTGKVGLSAWTPA